MQIQMRDIVESQNALAKIINCKMKAATAFKFRLAMKFVDDTIITFNDMKKDLVTKYGIDIKGEINIPEDIKDQVEKDFTDILDIMVDCNINNIKEEDFEYIELSPKDLDKVFWLIT